MSQKRNFTSRTIQKENKEPVAKKQAFSLPDIKSDRFFKKSSRHTHSSRFNMAGTYLNQQATETDEVTKKIEAVPLKKLKLTPEQKESRDRLIDILFIAGTIYFLFLSFGVWMTSYHYNEEGKIIAQPMSYEDIVQKKSFENLIFQYMECRSLYEEVLAIDRELAEGKAQPFTFAPSYEAIVTKAENLYTKTEALSIDVRYEQLRTMYLTWLKDHLAAYCKNMSTAISQNDATTAETALYNRETTYNNFSLITQNIIAMGETIPGIDLVNIREWDATDIYKEKQE